MRMNFWLLCGAFMAASLWAQQATNVPSGAPAGTPPAAQASQSATNTSAAGAGRKAPGSTAGATKKAPGKAPSATTKKAPMVAKRAEPQLRTMPLKPGPATVVASNVNVRGQARLMGEVLTRITKGHQVTVLEEITLENSGPEEPSAWAKILLPEGAKIWVSGLFIDPTDKTVKVAKLNLRGGPGENYSVIGLIQRGYKITEIQVQGDWIQIEQPEGAYGFVAAQYLKQDEGAAANIASTTPQPSTQATTPAPTPEIPDVDPAPSTPVTIPTPGTNRPPTTPVEQAAAPSTIPNEPAPTLTPIVEPSPIAPTTTDAPVPRSETPAPATNAVAATPNTPATPTAETPSESDSPVITTNSASATPPSANASDEDTATQTPEEPIIPRIVSREGLVRGSVSVQAPSHYELYSPESKRIINYLYNPSPDLDLSRYKGLRIIVTGQEGLDERWRNTPLLTIQGIRVLE